MKNISTGFGLALLAGAILAYPFVSSLAPSANASAVTAAVSAVSTAATAQAGPTIVWYGISQPLTGTSSSSALHGAMFRAWSNGRIEYKPYYPTITNCICCPWSSECTSTSVSEWRVFSDPAQGLTYRSDINFDEKVDGADLGALLADWCDAPRQDIPPSDCPLNLVNP
jgi:hypothetical protein